MLELGGMSQVQAFLVSPDRRLARSDHEIKRGVCWRGIRASGIRSRVGRALTTTLAGLVTGLILALVGTWVICVGDGFGVCCLLGRDGSNFGEI